MRNQEQRCREKKGDDVVKISLLGKSPQLKNREERRKKRKRLEKLKS